jgi:phosphate starvation-inducible PhoH-like protein
MPKKRVVKNFKTDVVLSDKQKELNQKIKKNIITIAIGPAGTSKTFATCYTALELLNTGEYNQIILTKPLEESGNKLGYLPGGIDDKIAPYLESYYSNFKKIIDVVEFESLIQAKQIEFKPTNYMRGATYDNTIMIADECQNYDFRELMLFATRLGKNSKIIMMGDVSQHDIKREYVGLEKFSLMIEGMKDVSEHRFTNEDIVRHPLLIELTNRYEKIKQAEEIKMKKN